ncbi:DEKNAAC100236 [Brettanomyces naardenensis]|uniref:DEKNAAC100236 n=1 Tax=Brettanomyces naardenensis TaxID=13370 RepID=A0A448YEX2_BRENA|nr:DEKNAAC100236 [Brettanomyces naardenensis]
MGKKQSLTASSSRKFVYRSFRDRVDSINIDPIRDLSRKPYEDTDTSFFVSTLNHWTEINLSKNFTELVDTIEPISQSLPQIIFHQKAIFDAIEKTLLLNDSLSLQPTLELLSQFCHDLGPDFMIFYERTLDIINTISVTQEDADSLEMMFNSLAYVFKYLSRVLSRDLVPTFKKVLPLLTLDHKDYITKFVSQAISFLVRKAPTEELSKFISFTFDTLDTLEANQNEFHSALVVVYSQALSSASGILHSKSRIILKPLTEQALLGPYSAAVLSDVIMSVAGFAESPEQALPLYKTILDVINASIVEEGRMSYRYLTSVTQVLVTLSFAESGRKVSSWEEILQIFERIYDASEKCDDDEDDSEDKGMLGNSLAQWGSILLRNADGKSLSKYQVRMFTVMAKFDNGSKFLSFMDLATDLAQDKTMSYCKDFVTGFIAKNWKQNYESIGYFLARMNDKGLIGGSENSLNIVIPPEFRQFITRKLEDVVKSGESLSNVDLADFSWRLAILENSRVQLTPSLLIGLIHVLESGTTNQLFNADLIGSLIGALQGQKLTDDQYLEIITSCIRNLTPDSLSVSFLSNFPKLLHQIGEHEAVVAEIRNSKELLISTFSRNLKTFSHTMRELSLNNIIAVYEITDSEAPSTIMNCRIIEQVPLSIQHGRDIQLRYRNLSRDLESEHKPSALLNEVVSDFAFGQLTVRFSPTWEGVFEFLEPISDKLTESIWENAFKMITTKYNQIEDEIYFDFDAEFFNDLSDMHDWHPQDQRLMTNLQKSEELLQKYYTPVQSIIEFRDSKAEDLKPTMFSRLQAIKLLNKFPAIAESHFKYLLPYVINEGEEDLPEVEDHTSLLDGWTTHDRNGLIELLSRFKNLNRAAGIERIIPLLLRLLMNKTPEVQKLALKCLLNSNNQVYNRYRDNLEILLDNTLFRDEVVQFLQGDNENGISSEDVETLMPLVLRILFGRALTLNTSGTKQGRKSAAINAINGLKPDYIKEFLKLSFAKINYEALFIDDGRLEVDGITTRSLRNINGFLHMGLQITESLRKRNSECFSVLIEPLIYSLGISEHVIWNNYDEIVDKIARSNRKIGFKLLYQITDYLGDTVDWTPYGKVIYYHLIRPRLNHFAQENLESVSSLMRLMSTLWTRKNLQFFLYYDDFLPVKALLEILPNSNAKESVILAVLRFIESLIEDNSQDQQFIELLTDIIASCLSSLVSVFKNNTNREVNTLAIKILLLFANNGYITENESRKDLIAALTSALERPRSQVDLNVKEDILRILSLLVNDYDCSLTEIIPLYKSVATLFEEYAEREMRLVISQVFESIGSRFKEFERVGELVSDLNSYSNKRIREPDYDRRLKAYRVINNAEYASLSALEWEPILHTALFFINDEEDHAMRSSASYTISRFVDCYSSKESAEDAEDYVTLFKDIAVPKLRLGLRKKNELIRTEYVNVIDHVTSTSKYFDDLSDMKVLQHEGDEETNFFKNIVHLQLHRRQRAIRRLNDFADQLSSSSIAHYLLPVIENYAFWTDDRYRNLANETVNTMGKLASHLTWHQFRATFSRYLNIMNTARVKEQPERLRDSVILVVEFSKGMNSWSLNDKLKPHDYPKADFLDSYIMSQIIPSLKKCLAARDEETIVHRVPLSEAMVSLVTCCSENKISAELSGVLTGVCQILRTRFGDLREAVRKHLGRIAVSLGPKYLKFIFKELKGALTRGPQIHILSYTVHYLLVVMEKELGHGDLSESADLIVDSIMDDLFGAAAEEKEAEGYSKKTKEMKYNKSYDTGELIAENLLLKDFSRLLTPVKYLLRERLSFKTQLKLDQLLRRFAAGLMKNEESSSKDILVLCYELYNEAIEFVNSHRNLAEKKIDEKEDRFLVHLDAKPQKTTIEYSGYIVTMQKFSFELLRASITKHADLFKVGYLSDFMPLLISSLSSDDERVIVSSLKVLTLLARLQFPDKVDSQFVTAAKSVLKMIKDTPNTNNDLAQNCLKFLSSVMRNKQDLQLKPNALSYILKKVEPDLDDPQRQGVAFGFLRSLISKHYMLPELYDTMDVISRIMVTSTSTEIREVARSAFYTFLMEYDQSRGRLEKQFHILIDNLRYPAQSGRQSVMELIHLIVKKSSKELLGKLSVSFFIALANVAVTDDSPTCREMASEILSSMLSRMKKFSSDLTFVDKYTAGWLRQTKNPLLARCGLNVYKVYATSLGLEHNPEINEMALERISNTLDLARRRDEEEEDDELEEGEVNWQMVYLSLSTFEALCEAGSEVMMFDEKYEKIWIRVVDALLYPHSWVRLASSRLVGKLLEAVFENEKIGFKVSDLMLQTIGYRSFRQLGAPNVLQGLASQVAKNLIFLTKKWNRDATPFMEVETSDEQNEQKFDSAFDWAINRSAALLRNESRPNKEMLVTKKAVIQYCAFLTSFLSTERLSETVNDQLLIPLINISEQDVLVEDDEDNSLPQSAIKCMELISAKLGVSEYNIIYAKAMKIIVERRSQRKTRKAQLGLTNPEVAARRKIKKHMRFREKRRMNKDENGLYRAKKKRRT